LAFFFGDGLASSSEDESLEEDSFFDFLVGAAF